MTLITQGGSSGEARRCDARCHNATKPECDCICGGRYHGKGAGSPALEQAVDEYGQEMVETLRAQGHDVTGLEQLLGGGPLFCAAGKWTAKHSNGRGGE